MDSGNNFLCIERSSVAIITSWNIFFGNHNIYDHRKIGKNRGIIIGNNVWIGANCCIVAGINIGDNVTIGAGCTIRQNIPSNSLVIQEPSSIIIKEKKPYDWDCTKEELL